MLELKEGMILYYGSYAAIKEIDLDKCSDNRDFGKGFYLTSSLAQAKKFVRLSINKAIASCVIPTNFKSGYVSVFRVIKLDSIKFYSFDGADKAWLHFVAANRKTSLFEKEKAKLLTKNVIAGKIANDRTSATLQTYINSERAGERSTDELTINLLLPNKLKDQYCFKDNEAIGCLEFVKVIKVDINED